jgi:hypothetical protein
MQQEVGLFLQYIEGMIMGIEGNAGVKQHRPLAVSVVCYILLCKADMSFTTTREQINRINSHSILFIIFPFC